MIARKTSGVAGERGAVLIQVSVALLALLALSAFVFDYGVMWASRRQAQNAADAGALAGAVALAFDYGTQDEVREKARTIARTNLVWGQAPDVALMDVHIEACPSNPGLPPDPNCVRVEAFRNQQRQNALPTFFGKLANVTNQGVRATATARGVAANAANRMRPWVVADMWQECTSPPWTQLSIFQPQPLGCDAYMPGTGFSNVDASGNPVHHGMQLVLKFANSGPPLSPGTMSAGWSMAVDLPSDDTPAYANNIIEGTTATVAIAPQGEPCLTADPSRGCLDVYTGGHNGPIANPNGAFDDLLSTDENARWSNGRITGSDYFVSPRIVPIAVIDPDHYLRQDPNLTPAGTRPVVKVVNILGFFIEGTCGGRFGVTPEPAACPANGSGNSVVGRLVKYSGTYLPSGGTAAGAFGTMITLVR